jgi:fatty acid desaturase
MHTASLDRALNSRQVHSQVNALRRTDNVTNWLHLGREYLFLMLVVGLALGFHEWRSTWELAWAWNIPVTLLAIFLIGVGQHRLSVLGHEGSHYILFRSLWLNEAASNWFCFFPLLSMTHNYRMIHMAHHQFVNDPEKDPDFRFMNVSGHQFRHPMPRGRFLWRCVVRPLLWVPGQLKYIFIRAMSTALGGVDGPYRSRVQRSRLLSRLGGLSLLALTVALIVLTRLGDPWLLLVAPAVMIGGGLVFALTAPDRWYPRNSIKPIGSARWWAFQRLVYMALLFTAMAWLTVQTGRPWVLYYFLLWVLPLVTVFPYLMMLREEVQHSNAGQDRFGSTRLFAGNPLVRWMVFPLGMDYHLPHHLFQMVPHYRLRALHELLLQTDGYRNEVVVVHGYFLGHPAPATLE